MPDYSLVLLPGDGTGPEVIREAEKVLDAIEQRSSVGFDRTTIECGGKHYLDTGEEWAEGSFEVCEQADAMLLGAIGWPGAFREDGDLAGGEVVLGLRAGLDLYANLRPVKLFEGVQHKIHGEFSPVWKASKVDMLILRENTEGLYHSALQRARARALHEPAPTLPEIEFAGLRGEVAWDPRPISEEGSGRVIRKAFEHAAERNGSPATGESSVTCVDKSNITRGCQLFRRTFDNISRDHPDIKASYAYIDAFTMWMVRNPEDFDVIVTSNMFGDIATDLGSVLQGGMGMAASANIGDYHGLFEPVHGSSPKYAGKNVVNPLATLNSMQMMLDWLGTRNDDTELRRMAAIIETAIAAHLKEGRQLTYDIGGSASTSDVGDAIARRVADLLD